MDNAAALLDITQSTEFVANVTGIRSTMKVSEYAECPVMPNVSTTSPLRAVSVYPNTTN